LIDIVLLAGLRRAHESLELCGRIEEGLSVRQGSRFDTMKKELLRGIQPIFSDLQQM
jgi:hypothetical protein